MHTNGEYSRYDHLSYNSSKVKVVQYVRGGEEIAKVGMTGYTYAILDNEIRVKYVIWHFFL